MRTRGAANASASPTVEAWHSSWLDPEANLAAEEFLFRTLPNTSVRILSYRNAPSVIVGRNQNPWNESDLRYLRRQEIGLYRRQSGGGTVYHDPGVLNVAILSSARRWTIQEFMTVLRDVLRRHGTLAELTPRHGLEAGGRKISGSASWLTARACLHHATVLFHADLEQLQRTLQAPSLCLLGHLVRSVPSPVTNLCDLNPALTSDRFLQEVLCEIAVSGGGRAIPTADPAVSPLAEDPYFRDLRNTHASVAWRFDRTPAFTHRLAVPWHGRTTDLELTVEEGHVRRLSLPASAPELAATLSVWNREFCGQRYGPEFVSAFLALRPAAPNEHAFWSVVATVLQNQLC